MLAALDAFEMHSSDPSVETDARTMLGEVIAAHNARAGLVRRPEPDEDALEAAAYALFKTGPWTGPHGTEYRPMARAAVVAYLFRADLVEGALGDRLAEEAAKAQAQLGRIGAAVDSDRDLMKLPALQAFLGIEAATPTLDAVLTAYRRAREGKR